MGKIEPITGRYIWVPYNGTEYRIFFEEAGQGI
ncbi:MAG: alpha/beta hydrolase, partial [Proteobacteria bacterium]|nr:alpha/beta hydrolase [Pseudomonadota bacterium]